MNHIMVDIREFLEASIQRGDDIGDSLKVRP